MVSKRNIPNQSERAFWREVFKGAHQSFLTRRGTTRSAAKAAALAATYADAAVNELRARTWRQP
jgi:hypothetical protein